MSGIKVLLTLLRSTLTSNISFIQLSSLLSGYPASSFYCCSVFSFNVLLFLYLQIFSNSRFDKTSGTAQSPAIGFLFTIALEPMFWPVHCASSLCRGRAHISIHATALQLLVISPVYIRHHLGETFPKRHHITSWQLL